MKPSLQRSLFDPIDDSIQIPTRDHLSTFPQFDTQINRVPIPLSSPKSKRSGGVITVSAEDCDWVSFLRQHGRVPLITDPRKPWQYSGWLMYYRILLEEHPDVPKRWDYWFRTMAVGHLLDEPIPEVHFGMGEFGERSEGYKLLDQWILLVDRHGQGWSSPMTVLLDWLLWGFGLSSEEPSIPDQLNEQLYRTVNLGPLLLHPCDYLGEWIALQKGKWNPNAFYPTPHHVVEMMTQMNFTGVDRDQARCMTVCDPCLGSGRMLLHASNYSLRLFGMDIDSQVVKACLVNGALYVPWLVRPFPEEFFRVESNSATFRDGETLPDTQPKPD